VSGPAGSSTTNDRSPSAVFCQCGAVPASHGIGAKRMRAARA
jgi:hypothetical protein